MGSGKTEAMLSMINDDPEGNYIFVTPYLDEVERVKRSTKFGRFKDPKNYGESKLESFHKLLADGEDIATTHSLFLRTTSETEQLISEGGYTLKVKQDVDYWAGDIKHSLHAEKVLSLMPSSDFEPYPVKKGGVRGINLL